MKNNQNIIVYENGEIEIKVSIDNQNETIWLTQKQIAELFDVKVPAISKHIKNIFSQNKLIENMVVSKMEITTKHGAIKSKIQSKLINIYNLDVVLAVHYPMPLHLQECFTYLGYKKGDFPISERVSEEIISLPMNPYIGDDEIKYIAGNL